MRRTYSREQKTEIIHQYHTGVTLTQLSNRTGVARGTLYKWVKQSTECQKQERKHKK